MVLALLPLSLAQAYGLVFRGLERMDHDALVSVLAKALTVAFTVAALALGGRLLAAILGQAAGGAGALAVAVLLLARQRVRPAAPAAGTAGELVVAGAPLLAMNLLIAVQPYLDAVLLSKLAAPTAVGWFGAAKYFMGTLLAPAAILGAAAYPRLSRAASDPPALRRELRAAMRPLLGLGALGAAGTFLFADLAVTIVYGEAGYGPTATLLRVFAPALPLFYVDWLLTYVLLAAGEARRFAVAKLLAVAVGALLELLLIPTFEARLGNGGVAVVLAFGASELVVLGAALWLVPRGALERGLFLDAGRAAAAGGAAVLAARALPAAPPLVLVPLCVGAFALAAAGVGLVDRASLLPAWRALRRGAGAEVPP
jgi:O-antigen/teichoic acid export membrane protein